MIKIGSLEGAGIYKISHPESNRIYIGSSINLKIRADSHQNHFINKNHHARNLKRFSLRVDVGLFVFEVLEYCIEDEDFLEIREQYYLDTLLKAQENNAEFFKLGFNSSRSSKRRGGKRCQKPILQYSIDGEFIREWMSAKIASEELNLPYTSIIQCALENKLHGHSGNFIWRKWKEDYPTKIEGYYYIHFLQKKLEVTNLRTGEITIFDGKRNASRELDVPRTMINRCIKQNKIHITKQLKFREI